MNIRQTHSKRAIKEGISGYLFMLPAVIGFCAFIAYPMIMVVYYSLMNWMGIGDPVFVGFGNFRKMFTHDLTFYKSLKATFEYVLLTVPVCMVLGLILALMLNRTLPAIKSLRTMYYIPVIIPSVASLVLWKFIFNPEIGAANQILRALGLPVSKWIQSELLSVPCMAVVTLWGVGSTMLIFLSGLQSVPAEMYEVAYIDGASAWQKLRSITLPLMSPILFLQLIVSTISAFQETNLPMILTSTGQGDVSTGGGPNFSSYLLTFAIYNNGFNYHYFGYAMAWVIILLIIVAIFTIILFRISDTYVYYENDAG